MITDLIHTVRDRDVCEIFTETERAAADACHAARNRDACQIFAFIKRLISDACHAFFHLNAGDLIFPFPPAGSVIFHIARTGNRQCPGFLVKFPCAVFTAGSLFLR